MKSQTLIATVVVIVLLVVAAVVLLLNPGILSGNKGNTTSSTSDNTQVITTVSEEAKAGIVDYTIDMSSYKFEPAIIEAEPGETLTILVAAQDATHDFVIDELGVESGMLSQGQSKELTISIPEDAENGEEYTFYCSISGHREQGMEGVIRVRTAEY